MYWSEYLSPIGKLTIISDQKYLLAIFIENQKYFLAGFNKDSLEHFENSVIKRVKRWLDAYFASKNPSLKDIPLNPKGTEFQKNVWNELLKIPYGETKTYELIAQEVNKIYKYKKLPYQSIGQAISRNPISIVIPCHRVIGKDGSLKGYAGGLANKKFLLDLEAKKACY